jgi:hypothetical protein
VLPADLAKEEYEKIGMNDWTLKVMDIELSRNEVKMFPTTYYVHYDKQGVQEMVC